MQESTGNSTASTPAPDRQDSEAKAHKMAMEALTLRLAQTEAKMDSLESNVIRQKERIKLLEKGLTLGLLPSEGHLHSKLQQQSPPAATSGKGSQLLASLAKSERSFGPELTSEPKSESQSEPRAQPGTEIESRDKVTAVYTARLSAARNLFDEGRFGKAYLDFGKLEREFDSKVSGGEPTYWLGRCWYQLKEYQQADQYFSQFIKKFPASKHLAAAKLYQAKNKLAMGLQEQAAQLLKTLIQEHGEDGSAEAAKQILSHLSHTL